MDMIPIELKLLAAPFICALIGWVTNYLAVKMLFRPRRPIKVLFFEIQGIFPKRQKALAKNLGILVEGELISPDDVKKVIEDPKFLRRFRQLAEAYVEELLATKLEAIHPMAGMLLSGSMGEKVKTMLTDEIAALIPRVIELTSKQIEDQLDFSEIVQKKVEEFSMDRLENILFSIMSKEFKFIEVVGAVLGFLIGVLQSVLFYL